MAASTTFGVTVDRLCRIRSGTIEDELPFPLDDDGFLDPSEVEDVRADALVRGALVPTAVAARAGALVLLGEPGVGKTTEFRRLGNGWHTASDGTSDTETLEVDAADLT